MGGRECACGSGGVREYAYECYSSASLSSQRFIDESHRAAGARDSRFGGSSGNLSPLSRTPSDIRVGRPGGGGAEAATEAGDGVLPDCLRTASAPLGAGAPLPGGRAEACRGEKVPARSASPAVRLACAGAGAGGRERGGVEPWRLWQLVGGWLRCESA